MALLSNSSTSTHILMSNSMVQDIEEWRAQFLQVKLILAGIKGLSLIPQIGPVSTSTCV